MIQAMSKRWKRLAAGLLLVPGLTAVGAYYVQYMNRDVAAEERPTLTSTDAKSIAVQELMKRARAAYIKGDYATSRDLALQAKDKVDTAKASGVELAFYEDSPDQLLADIQKKMPQPTGTGPLKPTKEDPHLLVKRGQKELDAGHLDKAMELARQAELNGKTTSWGLFEDTPTSLMRDIKSAMAAKNQADADKMLAQAKNLYERCERPAGMTPEERAAALDKARQLAVAAEKLHGPYSVWDLDERPKSLVEDIDAARAKLHVATRPPRTPTASTTPSVSDQRTSKPASGTGMTSSTQMASNNAVPPPDPTPKYNEPTPLPIVTTPSTNVGYRSEPQPLPTVDSVPPSKVPDAGVPGMLVEVPPLPKPPDPTVVQVTAPVAPPPAPPVDVVPLPAVVPPPAAPVAPPVDTAPMQAPVVPLTAQVVASTAPVAAPPSTEAPQPISPVKASDPPAGVTELPPPSQPTPTPPAPAVNPQHEKATGLMKLARDQEAAGLHRAARDSLLAARDLNAAYAPGEETPDAALSMLIGRCRQKLDALTQKASAQIMLKEPGALESAAATLDEAEFFAKQMGLETGGVEGLRKSIGAIREARMAAAATPPAAVQPLPPIVTATPQPAEVAVTPPVSTPAPAVQAPAVVQPLPPIVAATPQPAEVVVTPPVPTPAPAVQTPAVVQPLPPAAPPPQTLEIAPPVPTPAPTSQVPIPTIDPVAPPMSDPAFARGQELLLKAREELRMGNTEVARKIAKNVLEGHLGLDADAMNLLNLVDAEEFQQRRRQAKMAYEAGVEFLARRNYTEAIATLTKIDPELLESDGKRKQLGEVIRIAREKAASSPDQVAQVTPGVPGVPVDSETASKAQAADNLLKQQEALREVRYQQLLEDGRRVESEATAKFGKGEVDSALQDLQGYITRVKQAGLDAQKTAWLIRPVEHRLSTLQGLAHSQKFLKGEEKEQKDLKSQMNHDAMYQQSKKEELKKLVVQCNKLMDEHKFAEASAVAMQARQLDPDSMEALALATLAERHRRELDWRNVRDKQEKANWEEGQTWYDMGPPGLSKDGIHFPEKWADLSARRKSYANGTDSLRTRSAKEADIEAALGNQTVDLCFNNTPLLKAIDDLRKMTGLNIVLNTSALKEEGKDPNQPITCNLQQMVLRNALNIMLEEMKLKYIIEHDAIKITTQKGASGHMVRKTYPIADLIVPVKDYTPSKVSSMDERLSETIRNTGLTSGNGNGSYSPPRGLSSANGTGVGSTSNEFGSEGRMRSVPVVEVDANPQGTIQKELIRLITRTIRPDTWQAQAGAGTIEYYPLGMALVVNQTPDVLSEVENLLRQLRQLQDLEVAIEVRMVTLAESFYERIGVDFSMNIQTNNVNIQPSVTGNAFTNPPYINQPFVGVKVTIIGLQAPGVPTNDLNIPIAASSFAQAIPPFGGYQASPNSNGGISVGLQFLNDIQVQLFLEAAQGDRRTNVMQAPKLTMFNGQSAQIQIQDQQFFLTNIQVAQVNGQLVFVPTNSPFPLGVSMFMQPVVSGDRRFVRLNLQQTMTNLSSATVPLIPVTTFITPIFEGGYQGQPIPFTQYMQQPTFSTVNVQTTVVVPDGGTVVLGGLKWLQEGRNEFGPPVLSKIPYLNRLFQNVGYGREGQSLLMMVTPRIIINREEEERETGVTDDNIRGANP